MISLNILFITIIIGISLSMDAFSLSLIYGVYGISRKNEIILALIVGLFHFFMPLFGSLFGNIILNYYEFNTDLFIGIIFGIIGIDMIVSGIKDEDVSILSGGLGYIMFGLSVSIDSFTTGIGIYAINNNYLEVSFIFMFCSGILTYLGLRLGNILSSRFGRYANIVGGIIFIMLVLCYIF